MTPQRIALVHPLGENWVAGAPDAVRIANIMPPHGVTMLAAVAEAAGHRAAIVDLFARPEPTDRAVASILAAEPRAVGFSTTTAGFLSAYRIAEALKRVRPELPTVFGGVHATSLWARLLQNYPAVDMVVVGEGEQTLVELLDAELRPSADIRGLAFRDASGEVRYGGPRPLLTDLDRLPFPAYQMLEDFPAAYPLPIFNYPRPPATTFITSRGCPYACSYCDRSVFGGTFRFHSPEYMIEHLNFLRQRYGIRHVGIYDDNFTLHRTRVVAWAELMLARPAGMSFNCIVRPNHLDAELLRLLKRAGCWMINIGVESGDQELLDRHRQRSRLEEVAQTVRLAKQVGVRIKGLFMIGVPGETEASIERTRRFALDHPFDDVGMTKFTPFPGTPIYSSIRDWGQFDEDWDRMNCVNFVFVPRGFTVERLEVLHQRFYRSFYGQPRVWWILFTLVWKAPDSWRRFWTHLGSFLRAARAGVRHGARSAPQSPGGDQAPPDPGR